ncbi:F-box/kelch-repeat protein At1g57790-like [Eucalyptus grandis]|uniref:F-box/kelch-repeat protein At1g57790-like n=1 Tax=Eucalyptus grandis TaxID=71139 RepID=UPI00192EEE9F|nr:F-box/kelch-repeat protein At1g57790-like [Eucalyptus grandis]
MASWEELPQEILELIAGRLAMEDFLAFRGVCTSWRSAAVRDTYNAKSKAPWLMIYVGNGVAEFFSISRGRTHQVRLPGSRPQAVNPTRWILVSRWGFDQRVSRWGNQYCIFNPLSRVGIELPALTKFRHKSRLRPLKRHRCSGSIRIHRIALSSSPSSSGDYTVMVTLCRDLRSLGYALHRSGEDAWTGVSAAANLPRSTFLQLIHYDGQFVALDSRSRIMTLDERECRMQLRLFLGHNFAGYPYLVECSGALLVVWKIWDQEDGTVESIRVFAVDLEEGGQEEVLNLGNAALFLNGNSAISAEFNSESCLPGIKPNRIYFHDKDKKMHYYSMEDEKVEICSDAPRVYFHRAMWIQPDF